MAVSRALYITFYILYLITLAIVLWFLLHYSGVPGWVWIFFGVAILIGIVSLIIREAAVKTIVTSSGKVKSNELGGWGIFYIILQIMAFILVLAGLIFVIQYSSIPWWVWVILGVAILFVILATIFALIPVAGPIIALFLLIIAFIAYVVGLILVVIYSHAPWWIWILIGTMIVFGILTAIFEGISERPKKVVYEECAADEPTKPCKSKSQINTKIATPADIDLLPTSDIPEQVVYN